MHVNIDELLSRPLEGWELTLHLAGRDVHTRAPTPDELEALHAARMPIKTAEERRALLRTALAGVLNGFDLSLLDDRLLVAASLSVFLYANKLRDRGMDLLAKQMLDPVNGDGPRVAGAESAVAAVASADAGTAAGDTGAPIGSPPPARDDSRIEFIRKTLGVDVAPDASEETINTLAKAALKRFQNPRAEAVK